MPYPSIGGIEFYTMQWRKGLPFLHSVVYRQPNRAGNAHIVGPKYGEASIIITDSFLAGQTSEVVFLKSCAALCGAVRSIVEVTSSGSPLTTLNVFVESLTVTKSTACVGPGGTGWVSVLEWSVYIPEDW